MQRASDPGFYLHGILFLAFCIAAVALTVRTALSPPPDRSLSGDRPNYNDAIVRAGVIASTFWGLIGFAAGLWIALQLAFPVLNFDLPWTNFGRLRPVHTSAVIFAFGGNVLIATSFHVVQRTCRTRLAGHIAPWFVFWGYQLFIVLAASGYVLGITQSKEYAEPEWYVDLWLTLVWVAYLLVFMATLARRREPHIYVANWFYLAWRPSRSTWDSSRLLTACAEHNDRTRTSRVRTHLTTLQLGKGQTPPPPQSVQRGQPAASS